MFGVMKKLFNIYIITAERCLCLCPGHKKCIHQFLFLMNYAHPPATAACYCLYYHRKSNLFNNIQVIFLRNDNAQAAGHNRNTAFCHSLFGLCLITHKSNVFRSRTDKYNPCRFTCLGKVGILRKETITRVNGLCISYFCSTQDVRDISVTLRTVCGTDTDPLIGKSCMKGGLICSGIDSHCLYPELFACTYYTEGNLPAVCYNKIKKKKKKKNSI